MGNCVHHQSPVSWAEEYDEEWEWPEDTDKHNRQHFDVPKKKKKSGESEEENDLLSEKGRVPSTEVKIKITKKQLEELLRRVDSQGLTIQQVLAHLMKTAEDDICGDRNRHWRPVLQSIPEAAE